MLNLMAQYSLTGTVNNWEMETGILFDLLEETKPVIDIGVRCKEPLGRLKAVNRLLLLIWELLKTEIEEMEKNIKQEEPHSEKNGNGQKESAEKDAVSPNTEQRIQEEWVKIKRELPDFLCPKEETGMNNTSVELKREQKEREIKPIETKEQL